MDGSFPILGTPYMQAAVGEVEVVPAQADQDPALLGASLGVMADFRSCEDFYLKLLWFQWAQSSAR
jgi:hypothetical protein